MKAAVVSQYKEDIVPVLGEFGIGITEQSPDVVIAYGGDGTFLLSEREYPGIPKFPIRDSRAAPLCKEHHLSGIIKDFASGRLEECKLLKIDGFFRDRKITALNDIFIHNYNRNTAIRCSVWIDDELYLKEDANDGIGIATPHGSTAYFRSITNCIFRSGIGLAFSNSRDHSSHLIIPESSAIRIKVARGPVVLVADNSSDVNYLDTGEELVVNRSGEKVTVYGLNVFMCPICRALRHMKVC